MLDDRMEATAFNLGRRESKPLPTSECRAKVGPAELVAPEQQRGVQMAGRGVGEQGAETQHRGRPVAALTEAAVALLGLPCLREVERDDLHREQLQERPHRRARAALARAHHAQQLDEAPGRDDRGAAQQEVAEPIGLRLGHQSGDYR